MRFSFSLRCFLGTRVFFQNYLPMLLCNSSSIMLLIQITLLAFILLRAEADEFEKRMDGAIVSLTARLNGLRTGRATTLLLEPIKVELYGAKMSINQLGTISVPEPKIISVQVWDKTQLPEIEKAIITSGLGLNPISDTSTGIIRVPIPDMTEERRKELTKKASEFSESAKVSIRNVRRDAQDALRKRGKDKELTEDELREEIEELNKTVDRYIKKVDEIVGRKTKEIMTI